MPAVALVVGFPLGALLWRSGDVSLLAALAAVACIACVVFFSGSLLLRLARGDDLPAPAAWVMGVIATSLAIYALIVSFRVNAATAFLVWTGLVVAGGWLWAGPPTIRRLETAELVALALCAAATVFWCAALAGAPRDLARDGELTTWVDQFIHGTVISQFGDPRSGGLSMELAGVPDAPYHYASYMLPAVLAWPLDLPGLNLATSLWAPLGFFTACAAAYSLGAVLGGRAGGFSALGALTLLPDAASYGLYNRLFGYYWYVIAVPSASYAVAAALLSFALLKRSHATRDARTLIASAALLVGSVFVRVHVFALAFPAWFVCAALRTEIVKRRWAFFFAAAMAAFALVVWGFYRVFPGWPHALGIFLEVAHNQQQPVAYWGLYAGLMTRYGALVAVPVGVILVLAATLGWFGLLYPLATRLARHARRADAVDLMPLALLACYLLLILTAPVPPHGDATEFTQRPFVLVYASFAVWTAASFASWAASHGQITQRRIWLPLLLATVAVAIWVLKVTVGDWRWDYSYKVAEGLPQAAAFVRVDSRPGDVLATQGLQPQLVTTDLAVQLVSLTGVPAYLARPFMPISAGGKRARIALQRFIALRGVERESNPAKALARLKALGIRWYLVAERDRQGPRWDPQRRRAAFVDRMVAVYQVK